MSGRAVNLGYKTSADVHHHDGRNQAFSWKIRLRNVHKYYHCLLNRPHESATQPNWWKWVFPITWKNLGRWSSISPFLHFKMICDGCVAQRNSQLMHSCCTISLCRLWKEISLSRVINNYPYTINHWKDLRPPFKTSQAFRMILMAWLGCHQFCEFWLKTWELICELSDLRPLLQYATHCTMAGMGPVS